MRATRIHTRTLEPTNTQPKRVRVRSDDGTIANYPWDHTLDVHLVHQEAARKVAQMENPGEQITMQQTATDAMGYTFRAFIGEQQ